MLQSRHVQLFGKHVNVVLSLSEILPYFYQQKQKKPWWFSDIKIFNTILVKFVSEAKNPSVFFGKSPPYSTIRMEHVGIFFFLGGGAAKIVYPEFCIT